MIVASPRLNPLNHFQLVGPHMATLNEHPSSEAVLIQSLLKLLKLQPAAKRRISLQTMALLLPFATVLQRVCVFLSHARVCVSVCEVDMYMYVGFVPFIPCSLGPKWKPLVFQGVYMKIAIIPACICITYCLFSLCMYVDVLSSRCVFLVLLPMVLLREKITN